jgi:RNA polymerase sigma-70 factor (sigma-E family)
MVGRDEEFDTFVRGCSTRLLRSAWLLVADRQAAEDLLQEVLVKVYFAWARIETNPEAYARQALVRQAISRHRYRKRRPETLAPAHRDPSSPDIAESVALQRSVVAALRDLPPRQRAAVVLRYFEDLPEADAAAVLGCSGGTVRAQASRGIARLRGVLTKADLEIDTRQPQRAADDAHDRATEVA